MSRITDRFDRLKREGRKGFIPFITAGDPDLATTYQLVLELSRIGADVIELGVPFSDPMADGPVIQRASERALRNNFGISEVLELVAKCRREVDTPIILFGYFNPLLQFGLERLAEEMKRVGVDGVLVTDLVPEEAGEFVSLLQAQGLANIFLVAPTSTDSRLEMIANLASGFIYAVSRTGVTGTRESVSRAAAPLVNRVKRYTDLPVAVGFGISTAQQVREVSEVADAVIVGSAIVREIEQNLNEPDLVQRVIRFTVSLIS